MTDLVLDARLEVPTGPTSLRLPSGGAAVVEGAVADRVVAALVGRERGSHRILVAGRDVSASGPSGRVRAGLVVAGDDPVAADVSVRDHLAAIVGTDRGDALLADAPLLAGRGGEPAGILSGGERRVLGLLRARALEPTVVVLDRVGAGLDPDVLEWAGEVVRRWRGSGVATVVRPSRPAEREWAR